MPKFTAQQIEERNNRIKEDMLKAEEQFKIQKEQAQIQKEKQQSNLNKPGDGYYVQVLGDNEYGSQMGKVKHDDSYELIIPFVGTVSSGYEIYIARNDKGILEQRVRRRNLNYQEERILKYPQIAEQLDMIYHDIDAWRETIKEIKERNPKGE